jgi:hypothetical protein
MLDESSLVVDRKRRAELGPILIAIQTSKLGQGRIKRYDSFDSVWLDVVVCHDVCFGPGGVSGDISVVATAFSGRAASG